MGTPIQHPNNRHPTLSSQSTATSKDWPRFNRKVKEAKLRDEVKQHFGYEPHGWQLDAAVKVLEGNDGVVIAGTGKGKTMVFAILGLAVKLSRTTGYYIVVSPLKALESEQVRPLFSVESFCRSINVRHRSRE